MLFDLSPSLADLGLAPILSPLSSVPCWDGFSSQSFVPPIIFSPSKLFAFLTAWCCLVWFSVWLAVLKPLSFCSVFCPFSSFSSSFIPLRLLNLSTRSSIRVGGACLWETITLPTYHNGNITAWEFPLSLELVGLLLLLSFVGCSGTFSLFVTVEFSASSVTCLAASRILCKKPVICKQNKLC